jgi:signal transduction histidine kinase
MADTGDRAFLPTTGSWLRGADGILRTWVLTGLGLLALVLASIEIIVGIPQAQPTSLVVVVNAMVGVSFVGSSIVAFKHRPNSLVGVLLAATGLLWFSQALLLVGTSWALSLGLVLDGLFWAPLSHLLLSFPTGRLDSRANRVIVAALYLTLPVGNLLSVLFLDPITAGCPECPPNLFMVADDPSLFRLMVLLDALAGAVLAISVLLSLVHRWRKASEPMRRILRPAWWALWPAFCAAAILVASDFIRFPSYGTVVLPLVNIALAVLPIAFLVGLLRTQLDRSMVNALLVELEKGPLQPGRLREAIAEAAGDPTLELALWLPGSQIFVDDQQRVVADPSTSSSADRSVTSVQDSDGNPLALLIHDPALLADPLRVEAVASAARLTLENERLHAQLRAHLEEVRASRARIVEAADEARRGIERDLHDGAQQRLLALSLALERARVLNSTANSPHLEGLLKDMSDDLEETLAELRELARGIHPALLTDEGMGPAVESLARRAQIPTRVVSMPSARFSPPIEAAGFFLISEGLANATKHSAATEIVVKAEANENWLIVEVSDNGVGGAHTGAGTGLRGLEDRIVSLGGVLKLNSPLQGGTTVSARIPTTPQGQGPK